MQNMVGTTNGHHTTTAFAKTAALFFACLAALSVALLAWGTPASAASVAPGEFELKQPDGSTFQAQKFGDEWYNGYETDEGYTIFKDSETAVSVRLLSPPPVE